MNNYELWHVQSHPMHSIRAYTALGNGHVSPHAIRKGYTLIYASVPLRDGIVQELQNLLRSLNKLLEANAR